MFLSSFSKAFFSILLVAFAVTAQTSIELHQKYKTTTAVESFEVRPGIVATFFYREDGQISSINILPRLYYVDDFAKSEMSLKVADEILDELIPSSTRGKLCEDYNGFQSGRNEYYNADYENVHISRLSHNTGNAIASVSSMNVSWWKLSCPAADPQPSKAKSKRKSKTP